MAKLVSKTYGEALFELAVEEGKEEEFLQEIESLKEILDANPDLFEKSFSEVPSYRNFPAPHNVIEHVGEFDVPDMFAHMITSARSNGKAAYLESRETIAQLIKDAA